MAFLAWLGQDADGGDEPAYDFFMGHPLIVKVQFFSRLPPWRRAEKLAAQLRRTELKLRDYGEIRTGRVAREADAFASRYPISASRRRDQSKMAQAEQLAEDRPSRLGRARADGGLASLQGFCSRCPETSPLRTPRPARSPPNSGLREARSASFRPWAAGSCGLPWRSHRSTRKCCVIRVLRLKAPQ